MTKAQAQSKLYEYFLALQSARDRFHRAEAAYQLAAQRYETAFLEHEEICKHEKETRGDATASR